MSKGEEDEEVPAQSGYVQLKVRQSKYTFLQGTRAYCVIIDVDLLTMPVHGS